MAAKATVEAETGLLRLYFDRTIKLVLQESSISSDGGLLLHRELDDSLGLTDMAAGTVFDPRTGKNGRHQIAGFLRQSVFSRLACYEDVHDADRLWVDPVMRQIVGGRAVKNGAASASAMARFETEMLTRTTRHVALADLPGRWIDAVHDKQPPKFITLDMDSSESPVHGDQEGAMGNGRAAYQKGQVRHQMDAPLMHEVRRQRGAVPASRAGLQSRQLPVDASDAGRCSRACSA